MPFYHYPRSFTPLSFIAEKNAIKNGLHHSIFTSRFDKYIGEWKNDLKHGKGTFATITGKLYEGDWYNGFRHGFGTLSYQLPNGTITLKYRGDWSRGKPHGIGWRYHVNGDVYCGFYKCGLRHGYGKMWYSDATFYVGTWVNDKKQGFGMLVQDNGNRYEGHWHDDIKHGLGRFYHMHTGQVQEGCWQDDLCVKSKFTDIIIRQIADRPTPYPIPEIELQNPREILEESALWSQQNIVDFDRNINKCIDQM